MDIRQLIDTINHFENKQILNEGVVNDVAEGRDSNNVEEFLQKVAQSGDNGYAMLYNAQQGKYGREIEQAIQDMYDDISTDTGSVSYTHLTLPTNREV